MNEEAKVTKLGGPCVYCDKPTNKLWANIPFCDPCLDALRTGNIDVREWQNKLMAALEKKSAEALPPLPPMPPSIGHFAQPPASYMQEVLAREIVLRLCEGRGPARRIAERAWEIAKWFEHYRKNAVDEAVTDTVVHKVGPRGLNLGPDPIG